MTWPPHATPAHHTATDAGCRRSAARRLANAADKRRHAELREQDEQARRQAAERVRANSLVMKISDAEWQWDRKKLTLYFTAERRVDFRNLVRELASTFRTRIELKQIGVRDEAKRLDGVGRCGRQLCAAAWLPELRPVNLGGQGSAPLAQPHPDLGGLWASDVLPALRTRIYVESRRFPQGGQAPQVLQG